MDITTIPISKKFHDWLKTKGMKGESYEDVIKKLLKPEYKQELEGKHVLEESKDKQELDESKESSAADSDLFET